MTDILQCSALELAQKIKEKTFTVTDAVLAVYDAISKQESTLHCYITLRSLPDLLSEAQAIQSGIDNGELTGPLAGVPIAVKDNICTDGLSTTCASRILEGFVPPYSATVIERIREAGLILIGKTNMDEFGMGSTTELSAFGITRNPHNTNYSPGGSSGGSCAAVACKEAFLALGSDTGGSIRQPAAHCGVYGMKPTYGAVSRYGLIAYASSFDQIGPIGKTAEDCAALFDILCGHDPKDATSLTEPLSGYISAENPSCTSVFSGTRIAIPVDFFDLAPLSSSVRSALDRTAARMQELGASVESVSFGLTEYILPAYYTIACAEASSNLSRYDGVKYGYRTPAEVPLHTMYRKSRSEAFGAEVRKRILLGTFALSSGYYDAYYLKALKAKNKIFARFEELFSTYDIILLPVTADTAPQLGCYSSDRISMYQSDLFTVPANLAGLPAVSFPAGTDASQLPVGLQLIGRRGADRSLLSYVNALCQ